MEREEEEEEKKKKRTMECGEGMSWNERCVRECNEEISEWCCPVYFGSSLLTVAASP
jgi:hypothetical protein